MKPLRPFICTIICFVAGNTFAYDPAEGNINLMVGPYTYRTPYHSPDPAFSSPSRGGYALIATGDSNAKGSVELGLFYLDKIFARDEGANILAQRIEMIHITMGYRWWLRSWVSTSLSFFSAYPVGDPQNLYRKVDAGTYFDTSAMDLTEYGFDLALQVQVFGTQKFGVVIEPRYSWNVTPKTHESADHFGVLLGLRFMLQEKKAGQAEAERRRAAKEAQKASP